MCPCGSGKKFKKCCLGKTAAGSAAPFGANPARVSLRDEIEKMQNTAALGKQILKELGVFVFFSTASGDSWMLEVSDGDALQLSEGGVKKEVNLEERDDNVEIDWTHRFEIRDKQFLTITYKTDEEELHREYPCQAIHAAMKRIRQRYSSELLDSIHVRDDNTANPAA